MLESAMMGGLRGVEAHMAPNQRATRLRLFSPGGHLAKELAHNATGASSGKMSRCWGPGAGALPIGLATERFPGTRLRY